MLRSSAEDQQHYTYPDDGESDKSGNIIWSRKIRCVIDGCRIAASLSATNWASRYIRTTQNADSNPKHDPKQDREPRYLSQLVR